MPHDSMEMAQPAPPDQRPADNEATVSLCSVCDVPATVTCQHCSTALCETHTYRETGGRLSYCRRCADEIVGVCAICDALHTRSCRECGLHVCEAHQKRVIERWGWGGAPGQGGVTNWFPVLRTYCQEHGRHRLDVPKPSTRTFTGYDGSSPEW